MSTLVIVVCFLLIYLEYSSHLIILLLLIELIGEGHTAITVWPAIVYIRMYVMIHILHFAVTHLCVHVYT